MFESLSLSDLSHEHKAVLRPTSPLRPTLWLIEKGGIRAVVKDFSASPFLFRNLVGRFLVWRERKVYQRLGTFEGAPTFYGAIEGLAIVIEAVPGRSLADFQKGAPLPEDFFDSCRDLVRRFHARGLAHCDLKRASNILVSSEGRPYVVDWAAAILESEFRFFPLNRIFLRFQLDDDLAVIKIKLKHRPETVSGEEKRCLKHRSVQEKAVRALRDHLRTLLKRII